MSIYDQAKKNESYEPRAKTNQEMARSRYAGQFAPSNTPDTGPLMRDAEKNPRGQVADDVTINAPQRQITVGGDGKVRK